MNPLYSGFRSATAFGSILLFLFALAACDGGPKGQPKLPATVLQIGPHAVTAEVADTPQAMSAGLMHRESMADGEGMLFVYGGPRQLGFWMKDTKIPLSIAFIDPQGSILEIRDMQPFDTTSIHSRSSFVKYALEMNQGWFQKRGVGPGTVVTGLPAR